MDGLEGIGQVELGRYLSQVRERAGLKQAELARRITWSPAVLSRVESGDRPLAAEELEEILKAIETQEAAELSTVLRREWAILPRPPLDHPDQGILWTAEQAAKDLDELRSRPDVRLPFERRLSEYIKEIQLLAGLILKRDYQVAFVGSIGIGKSTAICRLSELEFPGKDGVPLSVLEVGAGGVTICDVHLRTGPGYGLLIEPRSDQDIRADVFDFAEHIVKGEAIATEEDEGPADDSHGISKEIERALRNMSGLKIVREKGADGKTTRRDPAKELARSCASVREFVVEVLARMELHRRDRRDAWYNSSIAKAPLVWLKETFESINNGRHREVTLPKRIEMVVPHQVLAAADLSVRIIDTRGIDRTAARGDLEAHLDDPHTLAVLCSGFNNAPAAEARLLLERAKEADIRTLNLNTSLLVLPRPDEALAVKDESGHRVETAEEGYELKGEQVAMALEPLGLQIAVAFFNSREDDPACLREFLAERLGTIRRALRTRMGEITDGAKLLLLNHEKEQVQEVVRAAAAMLNSWAGKHGTISASNVHVQDSLMAEIHKAYASTVRATVRRDGEWPNLSYSHHLGYGARRMAVVSLGKTVEGFSVVCQTLLANPDFKDASDLVQQAQRILEAAYEELLRKVQLMGQTSLGDALKADTAFWSACNDEWGRGAGYRSRVAEHNDVWFKDEQRLQLEKDLHGLIQREWNQVLQRLTALFAQD